MNFKRANTKKTLLEDYYEHFDENHRLETRHGYVEYVTTMKYIHQVLNDDKSKKILDVGAATGKYSIPLFNEGYDVTAIELVQHNIDVFKMNNKEIPIYQGNSIDLSRFDDNQFDVVLLFGPMYHLLKKEEKIKSLMEAKRVTKKGGHILVAYVMNEYAIITYGFFKGNIVESKNNDQVDESYHVVNKDDDLYSYLRIEDIDDLNREVGLKRIKIISADGPCNYMRVLLNKMDDETYQELIKYHMATCERSDLIGASSHTVDILYKE